MGATDAVCFGPSCLHPRALLQTPLLFLFSKSVAGVGWKETPLVTAKFGHCYGGRTLLVNSRTESRSATSEGFRRKNRIV